jgi:hypothetical protein
MTEWVLDGGGDYTADCDDCFRSEPTRFRAVRGGGFALDVSVIVTTRQGAHAPTTRFDGLGSRCARTP